MSELQDNPPLVAPTSTALPHPEVEAQATARPGHSWERRLRRLLAVPELGIALVIVALLGIFALIDPAILSSGSFKSIMRGMAFVGIIAIGQTLLLVAGELDISVGSVLGLCGIVASYLMVNAGWPIYLAVPAALLTGGVVGLINGLTVVGIGVPAFIATLGMLWMAKGLTYLVSSGNPINPLPQAFNDFGLAEPFGVSWAFWVFVVLAILFQIMLGRTVWGRAIYATGGNAEVAKIAGIRTGRVKVACYVVTGILSGLAGVLLTAQFNSGQPEYGQGYELEVIAGTVIGGVSLFGGMGTVTAAALGLFLMQVVRSGMVMSEVNTHWQTVAIGAIMVAAVAIDLMRRRSRIME